MAEAASDLGRPGEEEEEEEEVWVPAGQQLSCPDDDDQEFYRQMAVALADYIPAEKPSHGEPDGDVTMNDQFNAGGASGAVSTCVPIQLLQSVTWYSACQVGVARAQSPDGPCKRQNLDGGARQLWIHCDYLLWGRKREKGRENQSWPIYLQYSHKCNECSWSGKGDHVPCPQ